MISSAIILLSNHNGKFIKSQFGNCDLKLCFSSIRLMECLNRMGKKCHNFRTKLGNFGHCAKEDLASFSEAAVSNWPGVRAP